MFDLESFFKKELGEYAKYHKLDFEDYNMRAKDLAKVFSSSHFTITPKDIKEKTKDEIMFSTGTLDHPDGILSFRGSIHIENHEFDFFADFNNFTCSASIRMPEGMDTRILLEKGKIKYYNQESCSYLTISYPPDYSLVKPDEEIDIPGDGLFADQVA